MPDMSEIGLSATDTEALSLATFKDFKELLSAINGTCSPVESRPFWFLSLRGSVVLLPPLTRILSLGSIKYFP